MIIDNLLEFTEGMSLAGKADIERSATFAVDLWYARGETKEDLFVIIVILSPVFSAGGAAAVTFTVIQSDDPALKSHETLTTFGAIPQKTLVPGYWLSFRIPETAGRFLGVTFTPGGNDITGGTFRAFVNPDLPERFNHPAGSSVR